MIKLNEIFYQRWLQGKFKDLRKKQALNWFNENYFVALYDYDDNYVTQFEDVESIGHAFNIPIKEILRILRTDSFIVINEHKYKMYLVKKEKIKEEVRRR